MIRNLRIQNFKAWEDTGDLRLAPLTIIFGANSAGKSSLGHLLMALKQTAILSDRKRALHLGDKTSLVDLGTLKDCIHNHDMSRSLGFTIGWRLPKPITVQNSADPKQKFQGSEIQLNSQIVAGLNDRPEVDHFEYIFDSSPALTVTHQAHQGNDPTLVSEPLSLSRPTGRPWPVEKPEKFYRFSDSTLARFSNSDFLAGFALETERMLGGIYFLGPLRRPPERTYQWSGEAPEDVGPEGQSTISALLAAESRKISPGKRMHTRQFGEFIAARLKEMGVISNFKVNRLDDGRRDYEVLVQTYAGAPEVKLTDVGFGISQVLPALVQAFYAPPNSTIWMEQPEIHLHPQVQKALADVFISAVQAVEDGKPRNVQLVIESHSEHFLTRLQRRVAEGVIGPEDVAVYFCGRDGSGTEIEPLRMNRDGQIENWPENFFGDEMEDIAARTVASMKRRIAERKPSE